MLFHNLKKISIGICLISLLMFGCDIADKPSTPNQVDNNGITDNVTDKPDPRDQLRNNEIDESPDDMIDNPTVPDQKGNNGNNESGDDFIKYHHLNGWSFLIPSHWETTENAVFNTVTGEYITFRSYDLPSGGVDEWLDHRIDEMISSEEAEVSLFEDVTEGIINDLSYFKYVTVINYMGEISYMHFYLFVLGDKILEFAGQVPPLATEKFEQIMNTFSPYE